MRPRTRDEFEIAIICALPLEADAVEALFDKHYDTMGEIYGKQSGDVNCYTTGKIGQHNIVLCYMPGMGKGSAASVASSLRVSYSGIKLALVIGICGVPRPSRGSTIFLGDVIISDSVIEYDFGRQYPDGFRRTSDLKDTLGRPNREIRTFLAGLKTRTIRNKAQEQISQYLGELQKHAQSEWHYPGIMEDVLFETSYRHKHHQQPPTVNCLRKFFLEEGNFCAGIPVQDHTPLEERETTLEGREKEKFLCLVRKKLQWEPGKRSSAKELEEDEWLQTELNK